MRLWRRRIGTAPVTDYRNGPSGIAIGVTTVACVRRADAFGQIRARNAKAVVSSVINDHVGTRGHVAIHASSLLRHMGGMLGNREFRGQMTLRTDVVRIATT